MNLETKIVVENGDIFEGTREQFMDCFFNNADDANIIDWCKTYNYCLKIDNKTIISNLPGLKVKNGMVSVSDLIDRLNAMKNGEDLEKFDNSKKDDTTYCVDWGIKKGECIADGILDRYINELKEML